MCIYLISIFFFQAEDGIRDRNVTGVQTCALPISKYNQKLWKFQCYLGKTEFGEEVRTTRSGFQTKKEAQQTYRQLQLDFDKNKLKMNGNIRFKELYEEFIEQYSLIVKI